MLKFVEAESDFAIFDILTNKSNKMADWNVVQVPGGGRTLCAACGKNIAGKKGYKKKKSTLFGKFNNIGTYYCSQSCLKGS